MTLSRVSSILKLAARKLLLHPAERFTGNAFAQRALSLGVRFSHRLMGVGTDSAIASSGEAAVVELVMQRNKAGRELVIFDVGANVGDFLAEVVQRVANHSAEAHAFEPSNKAFNELSSRYRNSRHVVLNKLALSSEPGLRTLYAERPGSGGASLMRRTTSDGHGAHTETVQVTTLERYCAERSIRRIDLLKIDVEGYELDVLKGARALFALGGVGVVLFEFGGTDIDTRVCLKDSFDFFQEYGYQLFRVTPSGYLHPLRRYQPSDEQFTMTNYVALPTPLNVPPGSGTPKVS
jgi:FkbM family methyltransferase